MNQKRTLKVLRKSHRYFEHTSRHCRRSGDLHGQKVWMETVKNVQIKHSWTSCEKMALEALHLISLVVYVVRCIK